MEPLIISQPEATSNKQNQLFPGVKCNIWNIEDLLFCFGFFWTYEQKEKKKKLVESLIFFLSRLWDLE